MLTFLSVVTVVDRLMAGRLFPIEFEVFPLVILVPSPSKPPLPQHF